VASTITLDVDVQVQGGPKASYSLVETVEAYDVVDAVIPKLASSLPQEVEVLVQPAGTGDVRVLLITADHYGDLTYAPKDNTGTGANDIVLDAPQLLVGGALGLLEKVPQILVFINMSTTQDAAVRIIVGRSA